MFFGYIRPYKGLKYLIQALPKILEKYNDVSLLVIGQFWSKDKQSYLDLVNRLGLQKKVLFISDYVPNEELGKYFAVSDVAVLPYITATQSAAIQTAYAFNLPVIATNVGGLKDVLIEGKTGFFIKPGDTNSIVEKVVKFYRNKIKPDAIEKIKKEFSWRNYTILI